MHKLIYGKREEEGRKHKRFFLFHFFGRYATFPILAFYSLTQKVKKETFFHTFAAGDKVGGRGEKYDL